MDKPPPDNEEPSKPIPPLLYRYRSFPERPRPDEPLPIQENYEKLLERVKHIFTKRELYFPSPAKFNDPFDCRSEMLRLPETKEEQRQETLRILKRENQGMSRQQLRALSRKYEKANLPQKLFRGDDLVKGMQIEINKYGVLCLSEIGDDILIWSHYTNGHKGFCLVFKIWAFIFEPSSQNPLLLPVSYNQNYPCVPISTDSKSDELDVILRTKSCAWQYEQEWRVVWQRGAGQKIVYPDGSLIGVILGCRISDEHKQLLTDWTEPMTPRPKLILAKRKERDFGLDFFWTDPETGKEVQIDLRDPESILS